jgi:hypothetical protein
VSAPETDPPSGLPDDDEEITPLGVPADEGWEDHDDDVDVDLPGFPDDGEADSAG